MASLANAMALVFRPWQGQIAMLPVLPSPSHTHWDDKTSDGWQASSKPGISHRICPLLSDLACPLSRLRLLTQTKSPGTRVWQGIRPARHGR